MQAVKQRGDQVIVQDQSTAECFGMPQSAIQTGVVDWILPLEKMAIALTDWVQGTYLLKSGW